MKIGRDGKKISQVQCGFFVLNQIGAVVFFKLTVTKSLEEVKEDLKDLFRRNPDITDVYSGNDTMICLTKSV